jgi:hypothetical protein
LDVLLAVSFSFMTSMRRMRAYLGLRLLDVTIGTGVPVGRLSLAERGILELTASESAMVWGYLGGRLAAEREPEADAST